MDISRRPPQYAGPESGVGNTVPSDGDRSADPSGEAEDSTNPTHSEEPVHSEKL